MESSAEASAQRPYHETPRTSGIRLPRHCQSFPHLQSGWSTAKAQSARALHLSRLHNPVLNPTKSKNRLAAEPFVTCLQECSYSMRAAQVSNILSLESSNSCNWNHIKLKGTSFGIQSNQACLAAFSKCPKSKSARTISTNTPRHMKGSDDETSCSM